MPHTVAISVRSLVEYAFRSGDIDVGFRTTSTLADGTKAHQKIQKQYGEHDQKEVFLSMEIPYGDLLFCIDGRCDGLLALEDGGIVIDEIKSTAGDLDRIDADSYPVHWAQANCYAYMYALANGVEQLRVRLTYVHVDTEQQKRFETDVTLEALKTFIDEVIERYAPYGRMLANHRLNRDESIAALSFPYPEYREGQRKLAAAVYRSIEEGHKLFAKAPTGIGKTISTLFPAVKAIGQGKTQHLFYLTARTTTRTAAEDALGLMKSRGLSLHAVTLTAKEKICFQTVVDCRKETCEFADGYYDRINGAVLDLLTNETLMTRSVIEQYARKHKVCPFEFSLDAAYAADAVICDYNYVFDPRIALKRQTGEQKHKTVLLVDEAHNLVDRSREMFSASLEKKPFMELERAYKGVNPELHAAAKTLNKTLITLRKQAAENNIAVRKELPAELVEQLEVFVAQAERVLAAGAGVSGAHAAEIATLLLETFFAAANFIRISKLYDESYVNYVEFARNEARIKLFCLNPSGLLKQMGKGYRSHIYFSATFSPFSFYMDMLGADVNEDYTVSLPSPFDPAQWEVSVLPISTRYADRERTKDALVSLLFRLVGERPGNYLFFFPSYEYMNGVYESFAGSVMEGVNVLLQTSQMSEEQRDAYLSAFQAGNGSSLVGFAVMGGIFSEGIDLVGDRLQGVAVVGVGMPQIGLERNLIKTYFDEAGRNGFDYAYVFPGMNKVLQAGGRLIRSEKDRGVLALVDDRYLQPQYKRLLPEEWGFSRV